jgi:hypothetical protein
MIYTVIMIEGVIMEDCRRIVELRALKRLNSPGVVLPGR